MKQTANCLTHKAPSHRLSVGPSFINRLPFILGDCQGSKHKQASLDCQYKVILILSKHSSGYICSSKYYAVEVIHDKMRMDSFTYVLILLYHSIESKLGPIIWECNSFLHFSLKQSHSCSWFSAPRFNATTSNLFCSYLSCLYALTKTLSLSKFTLLKKGNYGAKQQTLHCLLTYRLCICPWFHLVKKSKCSFESLTEWVFSATEQAEKTLVSSVIG